MLILGRGKRERSGVEKKQGRRIGGQGGNARAGEKGEEWGGKA